MDTQSSIGDHLPFRSVRRLVDILHVLAKHGWRRYIERIHLQHHVPDAVLEPIEAGSSDAQRLRIVLEELGPTFVKFGQMLSVRQDLFPLDVIAELQKLQDGVPPFPIEQARKIIETEIGQPIIETFSQFKDAPLAAASIAQVHAATLPDGTAVVVKVQRPGIDQVIEADLEMLFSLARLLEEHVSESRRYGPVSLVEEFASTIRAELDFTLEGHNAMRFRYNFREDAAVSVPNIFWALSTKRVLTQEFSRGHKASADFPKDSDERKHLAGLLARVFFTQIFEHAFFHGDPHPGNVFIMHDGQICFHDFGIVGRLARRDQTNLGQLFIAIATRDPEWMTEIYFDMGVAAASVDRKAFARDLSQSLVQYYAAAAQTLSFAEILRQFIILGQRYEIRMPREFLMVAKAFMEIESQARELDPAFNMIEAFQSYVPRMIGNTLMSGLTRANFLNKAYRLFSEVQAITAGMAGALKGVMRQMQTGEAVVRIRHERIEEFEQHLDRASNRLSFSLIIAAIVIASSIVLTTHVEPHLGGMPLLGLIGYGVAAVLGLWWAVAILRSGKL